MNVIQCKNGHFFDGDAYAVCPHCGENALVQGLDQVAKKEEKKSFWGRGKKDKEVNSPHADIPRNEANNAGFRSGDSPTVAAEFIYQQEEKLNEEQIESGFSLPEKASSELLGKNNVGPQAGSGEVSHEEKPMKEEIPTSLAEAVKNASANSEGKTMSYFSSVSSSTPSQSKPKHTIEPVVGWLVCVKGCHFGECFSIFAGKNSIGRSSENRVVIAEDNSISRTKHALIVYEPKKRNFFLQPGDSSGLTYLNEEYITESCKLVSHDMIELGDSKFMFVSLCGEDFTWEDYILRGE